VFVRDRWDRPPRPRSLPPGFRLLRPNIARFRGVGLAVAQKSGQFTPSSVPDNPRSPPSWRVFPKPNVLLRLDLVLVCFDIAGRLPPSRASGSRFHVSDALGGFRRGIPVTKP
jgi:hypothetical protein